MNAFMKSRETYELHHEKKAFIHVKKKGTYQSAHPHSLISVLPR